MDFKSAFVFHEPESYQASLMRKAMDNVESMKYQTACLESDTAEKLYEGAKLALEKTKLMSSPYFILGARLKKVSGNWKAQYGSENNCIVGVGATPEEAIKAFNIAWSKPSGHCNLLTPDVE